MVLCQPPSPHLQMTRTASLRRISNPKPPLYLQCDPKQTTFVSTTILYEKPNASGLTPDQTRALSERAIDLDSPEARILRSLRELYSCKPQKVRSRRPSFILLYSNFSRLRRSHMRSILTTRYSKIRSVSHAGWTPFVRNLTRSQRYIPFATRAQSAPYIFIDVTNSSSRAPTFKSFVSSRTRLAHQPAYSSLIKTSHISAMHKPLLLSRFGDLLCCRDTLIDRVS